MTLVAAEGEPGNDGAAHDHHGHAHHGHDHGRADEGLIGLEPGFMSMIEMTRGTPRGSDGLQMEWIVAPFGPFFPGLPGGLMLESTLGGDSVMSAATTSMVGPRAGAPDRSQTVAGFLSALQARMPLAPVSCGLLACRAIEAAAGLSVAAKLERARRRA